MKLNVYSVYDKAVRAWMQPFYCRTTGEAIRSFTELANDGQSNVSKYPTDYELYALGEYDDSSGLFTSGSPVRVIGATEVLKDDVVLPFKESPRTGTA